MRYNKIFQIFIFSFFSFLSSTVFAQEKESNIETSAEVKKLIERKIAVNKVEFVEQYYAIQLYYGNYTAAKRILKKFKIKHAGWKTEISFETPNYKLRVGRFKDLNIANQKLEEIRKIYPSAFLLEPNNL